ncbi:hypothetical protein ACW5R3_09765 [Bizionia sp. KMM 8389]
MKQYLAIILIFVLSLRPIYFLGQVAYYELNVESIIQKYCVNKDKPELQCNGKCHLAKQLQIDEKSSDNSDYNDLAVLEGFFPIFNHIEFFEFSTETKKKTIKRQVTNTYVNNYNSLLADTSYKPPQV